MGKVHFRLLIQIIFYGNMEWLFTIAIGTLFMALMVQVLTLVIPIQTTIAGHWVVVSIHYTMQGYGTYYGPNMPQSPLWQALGAGPTLSFTSTKLPKYGLEIFWTSS